MTSFLARTGIWKDAKVSFGVAVVMETISRIEAFLDAVAFSSPSDAAPILSDLIVASGRIAEELEWQLENGDCDVDPERWDFCSPMDFHFPILKKKETQRCCSAQDRSHSESQGLGEAVDAVLEKAIARVVRCLHVGEGMNITAPDGSSLIAKKVRGLDAFEEPITTPSGTNILFPRCPLADCDRPIATTVLETPRTIRNGDRRSAELARGTPTVTIDVREDDGTIIPVRHLDSPMSLELPVAEIHIPPCTYVNPSEALKRRRIPIVFHSFPKPKNRGLFLEFTIPPEAADEQNFLILVGSGGGPRSGDSRRDRRSSGAFQVRRLRHVEETSIQIVSPEKNGAEKTFDLSSISSGQPGLYRILASLEGSEERPGSDPQRMTVGVSMLKEDVAFEEMLGEAAFEEMLGGAAFEDVLEGAAFDDVAWKYLQRFDIPYCLHTVDVGVLYWNETLNKYMDDGIHVLEATWDRVRASATHLTVFGGSFFVVPNQVDFVYVFAHSGFGDNVTIYLTLVFTVSIYVSLVIWARWQDRLDFKTIGSLPLPDNKPEDKYIYEILVSTGDKSSSSTDSVVSFILSGEFDETDVRTFGKPSRPVFRKGAKDSFVMTCPRPLGPLNYLRIWHDNSGRGNYQSWFLNYMTVRDLQTGEKYDFIGNTWFAVEEGDGEIDRLLPVASAEQRQDTEYLFSTHSQLNLRDGHLWFSVFLRPAASRFTRVQRVSSCMAFFYLSMLVSAMWYSRVRSQPPGGGIHFGPFTLSPEENDGVKMEEDAAGVAASWSSDRIDIFFRSVLAFDFAVPVNGFVLVRKCAHAAYVFVDFLPSLLVYSNFHRNHNVTIGVGVMSNIITFFPATLIVTMFRKARRRQLRPSRIDIALGRPADGGSPPGPQHPSDLMAKRKKKFLLPWWFRYVAWALVVGAIGTSTFFLAAFGIQFGNEKTRLWVTSVVTSFFSSILIVQPLKVSVPGLRYSDPTWKPRKVHYRPMDRAKLEAAREKRKREKRMWAILREIMTHTLFMCLILVLSYGNRDPNAFYLKRAMEANLIRIGNEEIDFSKVSNANDFWKWLHAVVLLEVRAQPLYNGNAPWGLRGYMNDGANRVLGYPILRQIRVRPYACPVAKRVFDRNMTHCAATATIVNEDHDNYCTAWRKPKKISDAGSPECSWEEFKYTKAEKLNAYPIVGHLDAYSGGGYVMRITGRQEDLADRFVELQRAQWISKHTRAVMLEFYTYNAQVNLFGLGRVMAEVLPGGGMFPSWRFDGISLLPHQTGFGVFVFICEIVFLLFVIHNTYQMVKAVWQQRRRYLDEYWNYAEGAMVIVEWTAVGLYFVRSNVTGAVLKEIDETYGNDYVRLQYVSIIDEVFGYAVAFICSMAMITFMKLLRFNKRIGILSATIRQCWEELTGYAFVFCMVFIGFGLMFYLFFHRTLEEWSNFVTAMETCFSMMLGKFKFESMKEDNTMASIFFFLFAIAQSIIMINILLTIIIRSFEVVKNDIAKQPNEYEMLEFIWSRLRICVGISPYGRGNKVAHEVQKEQKEEEFPEVKKFEEKMEAMFYHLNQVYFDGSLNYDDFLWKSKKVHQRHVSGHHHSDRN
ncbi:unnamed protein product [Darwinula stevensoni]|uniref:PLAT domain-containing protein n=1 Tax=Darwinula stevensoni TaxID=69355 RepID=A0A7R9AD11_9CRUS|nr:unnamed protein product [Darwinula stevensoni]CAG0900605.1 unnamed protein product [Darwinula stevensoni]